MDGEIPLWVYGKIEYETGYPGISGVTGFCYKFLPPAERIGPPDSFRVCDKRIYTHIFVNLPKAAGRREEADRPVPGTSLQPSRCVTPFVTLQRSYLISFLENYY